MSRSALLTYCEYAALPVYARDGRPWLWLVDPEARAVEVYRADERLLVASGAEPAALPPFENLGLVVDSLWG